MDEKLEEPQVVNFTADNWDVRLYERKQGKMKFVIKLNSDESVAFKNFMDAVKPGEITEADFLKSIFFSGWEAMNDRLTKLSQEYIEENKEKVEKEGLDVERLLKEAEGTPELGADEAQTGSGGIEVIK